jgi:hypothetical protein
MIRVFAFAGGVLFVLSLAFGVWSYASVFDSVRPPWSPARAVTATTADFLLFGVFALHHSLFARAGIKRWLTARVSPRLERSVYVWISSALFLWVCAAWRPVPGVAWHVERPWSDLLVACQLLGLALSLRASAALDVLALAGVRQALGRAPTTGVELVRSGLYGVVRHPIYFAWALMVWPTPHMTGTRLAFAAITTAYLVAAIPIEERSLRQEFGEDYERYATQVKWRMLPGIY